MTDTRHECVTAVDPSGTFVLTGRVTIEIEGEPQHTTTNSFECTVAPDTRRLRCAHPGGESMSAEDISNHWPDRPLSVGARWDEESWVPPPVARRIRVHRTLVRVEDSADGPFAIIEETVGDEEVPECVYRVSVRDPFVYSVRELGAGDACGTHLELDAVRETTPELP